VSFGGDGPALREWRLLASGRVSELYVSRRTDRLFLADVSHTVLQQVRAQEGSLLPDMHLRSVSQPTVFVCCPTLVLILEMWANAQPDGRPVEYR